MNESKDPISQRNVPEQRLAGGLAGLSGAVRVEKLCAEAKERNRVVRFVGRIDTAFQDVDQVRNKEGVDVVRRGMECFLIGSDQANQRL